MNLNQLLENLSIIAIKNKKNELDIKNIAHDSRIVADNGLFVAINGYITDGHLYVSKAIENGASVIIHEKELTHYADHVLYVRVDDSRKALGLIAGAFYQHPVSQMMATAVTGTNGKTTVTYMLKHIFDLAQKKCGLIGSIHNLIGDHIIDHQGLTTPESLDTQKIISQMRQANCSHLFMEVSSHALALDRVNGLSFDYAIFTNLTHDHLDYHKTFKNYFEAKAKLFYQVKKAAIIDGDDKWGQTLLKLLRDETNLATITYGKGSHNDYLIKEINMSVKGSHFILASPKGDQAFFINLPGEFMIEDATAAIINAIEEDIPMALIKKAVAHFPRIEGRMDILKTKAPFDVIIDYAHSPDSLEKLLLSVRAIFSGKIILVFGCHGDRDKEKRPLMGRIAGELTDFVVVTSDNPSSEEPMAIIDAIIAGVREKTNHYAVKEIRQEGIYLGARLCEPGDVLIMTGKGHGKKQILKNETLPYNEWDVAREAINRLGLA